jgi:RHS repeat-associated protein
MKKLVLSVLVATASLMALPLRAQTTTSPDVSHADDFQSYGTQKNPPGWVDTSVGSSKPAAGGLYKTWPDPLQGNQGANVVFGTKQSSGKPDGNNPRIGTFSTLTTKNFAAKGRFEYRGRFIRTNTDTRIGFTVMSSYPENDRYYLIGLWHQPTGTAPTMQLFSFGAGAITGTTDSNFTPLVNKWYRFAIQADDVDGATFLRARFWLESETEPTKWTIDGKDSTATRLNSGRIGIWSAVKGDAYIDDITAHSPVDHGAPVITFYDAATNAVLDPKVLALFSKPAQIRIDVKDDLSTITTNEAKLDGNPYVSGTAIAVDGTHKITVHAVDAPGNVADASLDLLVDTKAPVITLFGNDLALDEGKIFAADVKLSATIADLSKTTTVVKLNTDVVTLPLPVAEEKVHSVTVTSTDLVGNSSSVTRSFTVDKTAPVVTAFANGTELPASSAFSTNVTLTWTATDLTLDKVTATLDDAPVTSGTVITTERIHTLVITATDKATHSTTITRTFPISKSKPGVTIIANGEPLESGKAFKVPVKFHFDIQSPTPTTTIASVDGAPFSDNGTVSTESATHTISVKVTNASGLSTELGPIPFSIDLHAPVITLTENGVPFADAMKFARNVLPVVTVTDNQTANPQRHLFVDGLEFTIGDSITSENADHTISVTAVDAAGNSASVGPFHFILDKTKPVVTLTDGDAKAFAADGSSLFNHPVSLIVTVTDITEAKPSLIVKGAPFALGAGVKQANGSVVYKSSPISADDIYPVSVTATDAVNLTSDPVTASFRIDTTPPVITFTAPDANATVATPTILARGTSDDSVTLVVNDRDANIDLAAKTFAITGVAILEGRNVITAIGTDRAGNRGSATLIVNLDTRAPELSVIAPLANACVNTATLSISGRVSDPNLGAIQLSLTPGNATTTVTANADGTFSGSLPLIGEGAYVLSVDAADSVGHSAVKTVPVTVDRTKPVVELSVGGKPFAGGTFNHSIAVAVRAIDADGTAATTVTLGGAPYVSATNITAEGAYALRATALDCAGNSGTASADFSIDLTAPKIVTFSPASAATVASASTPVTGTVDSDDVASIVIEGAGVSASLSGRNFTVAAPLAEGANAFVFITTDRAGNSTRQNYTVSVKSTTPTVEILENGLPFPANALYSRAVVPVIRSNEASATITATLDNAPFVSGTSVVTDGAHVVRATATDAYGHSASATANFTIDRSAPGITITSPAADSHTLAASAEVKGSTTGNVVRVTVNGVDAPLATGGTFASTIALDLGANAVIATATDRAGNSASATLTIHRDATRPGIILSAPADGMLTNRPTITVAGQVLTPGNGVTVTINGTSVTPDATGAFRVDGFALSEGDNAITAAIPGTASSVTVHVTADFTPPVLHVLANSADMNPSMRFATSPVIVANATDNYPGVTSTLTIDGVNITGASPVLNDGGHALTAIARDAAGNQTRIDRTFSIGSTASSAGGCALSDFDPANNAAVFSSAIKFSGRTGGAAAVIVNGQRATIDSGSFATSLQLTKEGANTITIACANADGTPTTDAPITLTIYRYTNAPSIAITAPANEAMLGQKTVTVTGTVSSDVISGDVNGVPFTPAAGAFSVANVSLASGLNIITARGRNAAGRIGVATVRVVVGAGVPTISITSPLPSTQTSAATVDVSGVYTNVLPSSIRVAGAVATTHAWSDTTGTFAATVNLAPGTTTTIPVAGANAAGQQATASVDVERIAGPSIVIDAPSDNTFYRSDATAPAAISGTFAAEGGSTVTVNGVAATLTGTQFSAAIPFGTAANGVTPVIARVTTPGGASATDSIRVIRMPAALTVVRSFPEANATSVDIGTLFVVLFSNPLDSSTARAGISLADDTGRTITGLPFVDRDALSFAPDVPLEAGKRYTLTISTALKDIAGQSLASPFVLNVTTATTAPGAAPQVNESDQTGCFTSAKITGTASAAGVRVRMDLDGVPTTTTAGPDKSFTFSFTFSGLPGFHIARIREVGADGTLSPERDVCYRINCAGPSVLGATLDRTAKKLTIQFSKSMNPATLTASAAGTIRLRAGSSPALDGTVAMNAGNDTAVVTYSGDVSTSLLLTVTTGAQDATGVALAGDYTQPFPIDSAPAGNGYITGAVYDAYNGRPLQNAAIVISPAANGSTTTNERGAYTTSSLGEGAFTIEASAAGYTKAWRQVVVPSGSGVVPIDIRLTRRGVAKASGADITLQHGGDTPVTKAAQLFVPSAALATGHTVALTSVGGQSLAGLLPLGWSPLASVEIAVDGSSLPQSIPASRLTFNIGAADTAALAAANQVPAIAQYDSVRDEWRTVVAVATPASGSVTADIATSGNYALVYADAPANVAMRPAAPRAGTALQGVANPCGANPDVCRLTKKTFTIDPPTVAPNGRATATLVTIGTDKTYPSGTAVQAYIDEQLNLADGSVRIDPPFATDLLMYRAIGGDSASAVFHIAPTSEAAAVTLRDGVDHIRVVDYPGRIDRGALIGAEGGRVPGDDSVSIDIPVGATTDALHAAVTPMTSTDLASIGNIAGFHVAGGFTLALTRAVDTAIDIDGDGVVDIIPVTLLKPAKGTFTIDLAKFATANRQVVIAELLDKSPYGPLARLAATTTAASTPAVGVQIVTTDAVNPATLPVDGIVRSARYLILTADAPVAFAWGQVHAGSATGATVANALVTAGIGSSFDTPLGVRDVTRGGGVFALPVASQPASAFALRPRSVATGDGSIAVATSAPVAGTNVPFGALVLSAQPPHLLSLTPNGIEVPTSGFHAVATFDAAIDAASVAGAIVVRNLTTATNVAGTVTAGGAVVTFTPAAPLPSGSRFAITVQPTIRSIGGALFGTGASASFTTPDAPPANANIDRSKIRITIPVNGVSVIRGSAGALPNGSIAIAIRRGNYFVEQYQVQVGRDGTTDGSFSFSIGNGQTTDRVTTADKIDLQIQDAVSHSIIAVLPLTPFVTADGTGFIAAPDEESKFTSAAPLSVTVTVPAGAFDVPTIVTVHDAPQSDFAGVPNMETELRFYGGVTLDFEGVAKVPLEVEMPAPPGTPTDGRQFMLGRLGNTSRGPRIEIDDLVTLVNGKFTTRRSATTASARVMQSMGRMKPNNTLVGTDVRDYLLHVIRMGKYLYTNIEVGTASGVGWGAIESLQTNLDMFWDSFHSLYASEFYLVSGHGRIVVPVISNTPFTVQAVDASTGIQLFEKQFQGVPLGAAGTISGIEPLENNSGGPVPVFGEPFSVQSADIVAGIDQIKSVPGVTIMTPWALNALSGSVSVTLTATGTPDPPPHIQVLNPRTGELSPLSSTNASVTAHIGDRLVIFMQSDRVDPRSELAVVFNEPIALPAPPVDPGLLDAYLRTLFELEKNEAVNPTDPPNFKKVGALTTFRVDSGNRRVLIHTDLQSGAEYRLRLSKDIADEYSGSTGPLKLAQIQGGAEHGIDLYFAVRKPKGNIIPTPFSLKHGNVRDLALDGNLLFVSAQEGGLYAFDGSDPGSMDKTPAHYAWARAIPTGSGQSWAVEVDKHGRVWNTALTGEFGVIRGYRTEDFIAKMADDPASPGDPNAEVPPVDMFGGGTVSWRTGINVGFNAGIDQVLLSDRPEATPRKLQIVTQDDSLVLNVDKDFDTKLSQPNTLFAVGTPTGTSGDFRTYTFQIPTSVGAATPEPSGYPYVTQRITVRNVTAGFRWSKDGAAGPNGSTTVTFQNVLVRAGDQIRIERNMMTYGVVTLFGYGVGVYDFNAIESNSRVAQGVFPTPPPYKKLATMVDLTTGGQTLTFCPEAILTADTFTDLSGLNTNAVLNITALVPASGLSLFSASPKTGLEANGETTGVDPNTGSGFGSQSLSLIEKKELKTIKKLVSNDGARPFMGRFNSIARYDVGDKIFALVSGGQYGIIAVDITTPSTPQLAGIIWVPKGAWAVRVIGDRYATSLDGDGRSLLIDLSRLDERNEVPVAPCTGCDEVFPTLAAALKSGQDPADSMKFGSDDPRIVWRGEKPVNPANPSGGGSFNTTLAPVADPDTGIFYSGTLLQPYMRVQSGMDPRVSLKVNLGTGSLSTVSSIVPLGIQPQKSVADQIANLPPCVVNGTVSPDTQQPTACRENASLGVFRIEVALPGAASTAAGGDIDVALESERIIDVPTEQTKDPLPRAHLRQHRMGDGSGATVPAEKRPVTFTLKRVLSDSYVSTPAEKALRFQKGFNRFISPWVVAVADPRASTQYTWGVTENKADAGCFQCERPVFLAGPASTKKVDVDYYEIYTLGRYLTLRPDVTTDGGTTTDFDGAGNYKYLGDRHRIFARFGTVQADTVRPANVLVAANEPPVARGTLLGTVFLHSGEVQSETVDLNAGGRAGWDVLFDRTYRSRTLGGTAFGFGWDSAIFQRLRPLPTGDVEYRDGSEVWMFRLTGTTYTAPKGLNLNLVHTEKGWTIIDQKKRITFFDELGRIAAIADEFFTHDGKGNLIRYNYDESGRLSSITDSVSRTTNIEYWADADHDGLIKKITDWHKKPARTVDYTFDDKGRLTEALLPAFDNASGGASVAPKRKYEYDTNQISNYNDKLELATNLTKNIEPVEAAIGPGNQARVEFIYSGPHDYVKRERWGTGDVADFNFTVGATPAAVVTDVLGQTRHYTFHMPPVPADNAKLDWYSQQRAHFDHVQEDNVVVSTAPFGQLPSGIPAPTATPATTSMSMREFRYTWNDADDTLSNETLMFGWKKDIGYTSAGPNLGNVANDITISAYPQLASTAGRMSSKATPAADSLNVHLNFRAGTAYLDSLSAGGLAVQAKEAERNTLTVTDTNSVATTSAFDPQTGLPTSVDSTGGTGSGSSGGKAGAHYPTPDPSQKLWERGRPDYITQGTALLRTDFKYPEERKTIITDPQLIVTTIDSDTWGRPSVVSVDGPGTDQDLHYEIDYDANGRVHERRRLQGSMTVRTTYEYDVLGRVKSVTTDNLAAAAGATTSATESNDYSQFSSGTLKHTSAGGAVTTTTVDKLGRTTRVSTTTGAFSNNILSVTAYDIADHVVYVSDTLKFATTMAYAPNGRLTDTQHADGSKQHFDYDGWGRVTRLSRRDKNDTEISYRQTSYTPDGQVQTVTEGGAVGGSRSMTRAWDGAGRTSGVAISGGSDPRAMTQTFDDAGRIQTRNSGVGSPTSISTMLSTTMWSGYTGYIAPSVTSTENHTSAEPQGNYTTNLTNFDTLGNPQTIQVGSLTWTQKTDQAGYLTDAAAPERGPEHFDRDARGAVTTQTLGDGRTQTFDYHLTGVSTKFTDPKDEFTRTTPDLLGRPTRVDYMDGTSEVITYEGARVFAVKDRQDRWQSYVYDNGHLKSIWATPDGVSSFPDRQLDEITYDDAGRVIALTNPDAKIEFLELTFDGKPKRTRQTRYRNHMGLHPGPNDVIDAYEQTHSYNSLGERTGYSIPPGAAPGFPGSATLQYDAMGNVKQIQLDDGVVMNSDFRAAGRPNYRDLSLPATGGVDPKILRRLYRYYGDTGQLQEMVASVRNPISLSDIIVAGTRVSYDGLKVDDAQLLGVSGSTRHSRYSYDARGRLSGFVTAASGTATPPPAGGEPKAPGSAAERPDDADFRAAQVRVPLLDATTKSVLAQHGVDPTTIDPPSVSATDAPGHKLGKLTRGTITREFNYGGKAELIDDGIFLYYYDGKGRLSWTMEKPFMSPALVRRVVYVYDSRNRLVGRSAQSAQVLSLPVSDVGTLPWQSETRADILAADALPAETTFIWDPVADRLMSVVRTGTAEIIKQFIHGEQGYDDPIQITTLDPNAPTTAGSPPPVKKLYPIYDEAGGGSLQVVLNNNGEIIARSITTDPYGASRSDLSAGTIDQVRITATKNDAGVLTSVKVAMRSTEQLSPTSINNGTRLAVVAHNGNPLRTSTATPVLNASDPYTIEWTLTAAEWTTLADPAPVNIDGTQQIPESLSIAATSNLRAQLWASETTFLPAPTWATASKPVFTSSNLPLEVRESLENIRKLITDTGASQTKTAVSWDIPNLSLIGTEAGNPDVASLFNSSFQAQPFSEPFTHKVYVRERWYDPSTGMWLTPDPAGYQDSSSLYAFAGGDPINGRDPVGLATHTVVSKGTPSKDGFVDIEENHFENKGDYFDWLIANGVQRDVAMESVAHSGLPDTPLAPNAAATLRRSADLAWPLVGRLAGGFGVIGSVAQGYAAVETGNPTLGLLAVSNGISSAQLMVTGESQMSPVASAFETVYSTQYSPKEARNRAIASDFAWNLFAGFTPGLRGGSSMPAVAEPEIAAPGGAEVPAQPTVYSTAFETQLSPSVFGRSRSVHFNRSNAALDNALLADKEFAAAMDKLIPGVQESVSSTGGRQTPAGWTWEHAHSTVAEGRTGVMRLVPTSQHTPGSPFWRVLHPALGAAGGYSEWAIPAGAPKN